MKIKVPSIEKQKEIVEGSGLPELKQKKIRTSFELTEVANRFLESEAEAHGLPPSEVFRRIIEETEIDTGQHKKRLKNLTVYQSHIDKLEQIAGELVPDTWKGKRGGNKSGVAELLIKEYMKK